MVESYFDVTLFLLIIVSTVITVYREEKIARIIDNDAVYVL